MMKQLRLLLVGLFLLVSNLKAVSGTFTIVDVRNNYQSSGSSVEYLVASFSLEFSTECQAVPGSTILLTGAGSTYFPSAVYPNSFYTSRDGSLMFQFYGGQLSTEGDYVLTIPAGSFVAPNGDTNEAFTGTWSVRKPEQFAITKVSNRGFKSGTTVTKLDMYFVARADVPLVSCDGSRIELRKGSTRMGYMSSHTVNADGSYTFCNPSWLTGVENGQNVGENSNPGTWTLVFEQGAFRDAQNRVSAPFECSWVVSSSAIEGIPDDNPGVNPGEGDGDDNPGVNPGEGDGDDEPGVNPGEGDGDDEPGVNPGEGDGDDEPGVNPGEGDGDDDPGVNPGEGDGDDDPGVNPGEGDGDDEPGVNPGEGDGDDNPGVNPGEGDGDDDPDVNPGEGDGDDDDPEQPEQPEQPAYDGKGTADEPYVLTEELACPGPAAGETAYYTFVAPRPCVVTFHHNFVGDIIGNVTVGEKTSSLSLPLIMQAGDVAIVSVRCREDNQDAHLGLMLQELKEGMIMSTALPLAEGVNEIEKRQVGDVSMWYKVVVPAHQRVTVTFNNYLVMRAYVETVQEKLGTDQPVDYINTTDTQQTVYIEVQSTNNFTLQATVAYSTPIPDLSHIGELSCSVEQDGVLPVGESIRITLPNRLGGRDEDELTVSYYIFGQNEQGEFAGAPLNLGGTTEVSGTLGSGVVITFDFEPGKKYRLQFSGLRSGNYSVPCESESMVAPAYVDFYVDDPTGIVSLSGGKRVVTFDLSGRRVSAVRKGLYVQHGKVILKK